MILRPGPRPRSFSRNERGNVAILFSATFFVLMALVGFGVDFASQLRLRTDLQNAADTAALAAVSRQSSTLTEGEIETKARNYFAAQTAGRSIAKATATIKASGTSVVINASLRSKSLMGALYGQNEWTVGVHSKATADAAGGVRTLDVAMCIDATSSMTNTISAVKSAANSFYADLNAAIKARGLAPYDDIRIRLLIFRDYSYANGESFGGFPQSVAAPMKEYPFVIMPGGAPTLSSTLAGVSALGGGDNPESAMECWNFAMTSPWLRIGDPSPTTGAKITEATPLIVLWSDSYVQPIPDTPRTSYGDLRAGFNAPNYPSALQMPRLMSEFIAKWNNPSIIDQKSKMFMVFGLCQKGAIYQSTDAYGYVYQTYYLQDGAWHFYDILQQANRSYCAGTLTDGTITMIDKLADGIKTLGSGVTGQVRLAE